MMLKLAQLKYPSFPIKVTPPQATVSAYIRPTLMTVHVSRNMLFLVQL